MKGKERYFKNISERNQRETGSETDGERVIHKFKKKKQRRQKEMEIEKNGDRKKLRKKKIEKERN